MEYFILNEVVYKYLMLSLFRMWGYDLFFYLEVVFSNIIYYFLMIVFFIGKLGRKIDRNSEIILDKIRGRNWSDIGISYGMLKIYSNL